MSFTMAITGKGGVGKTTVAALAVSRLIAAGRRPVLAVDADPNTCLDSALGVRAVKTVGGVREEAKVIANQGLAAGVSKSEMLELKIAESLVEADDFDLVAMGRPEGPGCYCYANSVLKQTIGHLAGEYPYVVIDNEAGLENLSRRIVQKVDVMVMVADPSARGLATVARLHELAMEMRIAYGHLVLVINRLRRDEAPAGAEELGRRIGAGKIVLLPDDENLAAHDERGESLLGLNGGNLVVRRIDEMLSGLLAQA